MTKEKMSTSLWLNRTLRYCQLILMYNQCLLIICNFLNMWTCCFVYIAGLLIGPVCCRREQAGNRRVQIQCHIMRQEQRPSQSRYSFRKNAHKCILITVNQFNNYKTQRMTENHASNSSLVPYSLYL